MFISKTLQFSTKTLVFRRVFYSAYLTNINQKTFQLDISFSRKSLKSKKHYAKMYLNKSAKADIERRTIV